MKRTSELPSHESGLFDLADLPMPFDEPALFSIEEARPRPAKQTVAYKGRLRRMGKRMIWSPSIHDKRIGQTYVRNAHRAGRSHIDSSGVHAHFPYATGGIPGGSPYANLERHRDSGNTVFYVTDLSRAYDHVDRSGIPEMLETHPGLAALGRPLLHIDCTLHPDDPHIHTVEKIMNEWPVEDLDGKPMTGLPQGDPLSPLLFNASCTDMDTDIAALTSEHGGTYTRYMDDLTISTPNRPLNRLARRTLREIIGDHGHRTSEEKTRNRLVLTRETPVTITGMSLYTHAIHGRYIQPSPKLVANALAAMNMADRELSQCVVGGDSFCRAMGYRGALLAGIDRTKPHIPPKTKVVLDRSQTIRTRHDSLLQRQKEGDSGLEVAY